MNLILFENNKNARLYVLFYMKNNVLQVFMGEEVNEKFLQMLTDPRCINCIKEAKTMELSDMS